MTSLHVPSPRIAEAVARLTQAASSRNPCDPVRDLIGPDDVDAAYAVQRALSEARVAQGGVIAGRKIGLTSTAVQQQLGVDQPDFGVLFEDMRVPHGRTVELARLLQPRIEAEVAFVLGADLSEGRLDADQVRAAVAYAVPALEIVDSRIVGWDITFGDTVADNGSSGLYVLGDDRVSLDDFEPMDAVMSMRRGDDLVSSGEGSACLGDPLIALAWLARTMREAGDPLLAGQVVLSGALGPMVAVAAGDSFYAEISGLGSVHASFDHPSDDGKTS